jgi:NAD(P)-dependent dehydrogenase (short-subunit alcohol dehydrogenase family)
MFKDGILRGKVALVTGGGTGLGFSMADRFASLGAGIALISRDPAHLEPAAEKLRAHGTRIATAVADVRDFAAVDAAVERLTTDLGPIGILVNNAAGNFLSPTETLSDRAFAAVVGIVLNGTFHATQACARRMIDRGSGGVVLNIVATYAWTGTAFAIPSAAAKAGVLAMTRSLAVEWAPHRIRLNALAPGFFPTPGAATRLVPTEEMGRDIEASVPLKRFGRHEELADLATYLVSDFSGYMTGECVTLDGGRWLQGAGPFNHLVGLSTEGWAAFARSATSGRAK